MDNLFDIIVFIAIGVGYTVWNLFMNKGEDGSAPSGPPDGSGSPTQEEDDYAQRQRKIQDEIRRKIAERRGEEVPSGNVVTETRQASPPPIRKEVSPPVPPYLQPTRSEPAESEPEGFSWDESDNAYTDGLQKRLEQIEQTKRQAAALREKGSGLGVDKSGTGASRSKKMAGGVLSGPVRDILVDPAAARTAFVYAEVLGAPKSLRNSVSDIPGLRK